MRTTPTPTCRHPILTDRETDILALLLDGETTKETAQKLGISPKTVETYRGRIRAKLNAKNTVELVRHAIENGFIKPTKTSS